MMWHHDLAPLYLLFDDPALHVMILSRQIIQVFGLREGYAHASAPLQERTGQGRHHCLIWCQDSNLSIRRSTLRSWMVYTQPGADPVVLPVSRQDTVRAPTVLAGPL